MKAIGFSHWVVGSSRQRRAMVFLGLAGWLAGFSAQAQITNLTWKTNNVSVGTNVPFTVYTNRSAFHTALSTLRYVETFDGIDAANTYGTNLSFSKQTNNQTLSYTVSSPKNMTHSQRTNAASLTNGFGAPGGVAAGPYDYDPVNEEYFNIGGNQYLQTYFQADPLLFNNFSSNIRAVGGYFYPTDYFGDWIPNSGHDIAAPISVSVGIGSAIYTAAFSTVKSAIPDPESYLYSTDTYLGLVFTGSLSSLRFANGGANGNEGYMTVSEFTVGGANSAVAIPEPSTLASFAVGGVLLLALRRVRKA